MTTEQHSIPCLLFSFFKCICCNRWWVFLNPHLIPIENLMLPVECLNINQCLLHYSHCQVIRVTIECMSSTQQSLVCIEVLLPLRSDIIIKWRIWRRAHALETTWLAEELQKYVGDLIHMAFIYYCVFFTKNVSYK